MGSQRVRLRKVNDFTYLEWPLIYDWINKLRYINITILLKNEKKWAIKSQRWMKPKWMLLSKISSSVKGYTLHAANYMTVWKMSNCRANKKYQRLFFFCYKIVLLVWIRYVNALSSPTLIHKSTQSESLSHQSSYSVMLLCAYAGNVDIGRVEVTAGCCGKFQIPHPGHKFHKVHLELD